jgi:hypothetical protein
LRGDLKMLKRFNAMLLYIICILPVLFVSATACTQVKTPTVDQSILLNNLTAEDGFVYKDYTWFLSESDFFKLSKMDEKTSILSKQAAQTILSDKKTQTYKVPRIIAFPVFTFEDGKLIKVQLDARFTDNQSYMLCAKEIKSILDKYLEKPDLENTDFLSITPPVTGAGAGGVKWDGKDGSCMQIYTFNHTQTDKDNPYYVIVIEICAPVSHDSRSLPPG